MARYDYHCSNCNITFEVEHPMTARPTITCPNCGQKAERVFEPSGIAFKGTGFYNTDQRNTSSSSSKSSCAHCSGGNCESCAS
ncbi:FmdB family zinc ribbon protein [Olsenella sp. Marseille-QA0557]|uniref:Zinc ribbon domain-containing protein n=1 Tax=Candidatus Coprovicinus avistercoris TaxID=2840754 RepID=A0A9D1L4Y0_9ACTN|nr:zinc ribbon domain-containing protein [Candidatus Coprovicinus avistercoris]